MNESSNFWESYKVLPPLFSLNTQDNRHRRHLYFSSSSLTGQQTIVLSSNSIGIMKSQLMENLLWKSISTEACKGGQLPMRNLPDPACQCRNPSTQALTRPIKIGKKADNEHERLRPKISEIVKRKLRMIQEGGVKRLFKRLFNIRQGEELFKASHCYISTTCGPIAGLLFISSDRVAFCSEKLIRSSSSDGKQMRFHYKVMIPLKKIKIVDQSENVKKPSEKYVEIVTKDNFDFWFMGFLNHQKALYYLQQAISQA